MTVIVVKDRIMASDSLLTGLHCLRGKKISRLKDGSLFGASGRTGDIMRAVAWLNGEIEKAPAETGFSGLRLMPDGKIRYYDRAWQDTQLDVPFLAVGSGADYAMGALATGATVEEAVLIACRYDESCGGPVAIEELDKWPISCSERSRSSCSPRCDPSCRRWHVGR